MAFDGRGRVLTYNGQRWSQPVQVESASTGGIIAAISCASPRFCAAVDSNGDAAFDLGHGWSRFGPVADSTGLSALSCPSVGICFATDNETSEVYRFSNRRWVISASLNLSTPQGGSEPNTLNAISCSASNYCVALDDFGEGFTYDGTWSSSPRTFDAIQLGDASLSCTTDDRCVIVDDRNDVVVDDDGTWSAAKPLGSRGATLVAVSCAPRGRCVVVDDRGGYLISSTSTPAGS